MGLPPARLLLAALLLAACAAAPPPAPPTPTAPPLATTVILGAGAPADLPAVAERRRHIAAALAAPPFIRSIPRLDPALAAAQQAALGDPRVLAATRTADGRPLRAEVMAVAAARAGDIPTAAAAACPSGACARVVIYVYPSNTTVTALARAGAVVEVQSLAGSQPEIPADLAELAVQIAIADPQLAAAFEGLTPSQAMAAMSATKTSLAGTSCERRRHLCVAPVFSWGQSALWTIIDLTDFTLVAATTWTEQGASGRRRIYSEATLQDAAVAPLCETPQTIERGGWRLSYMLTSSDGLELRDVSYQGRPLLTSAKVVDWHVGYAGNDQRRVGFSDAIGCPVFSSAAVIPYGPPALADRAGGGFELSITFRSPNWPQPCNYQYTFSASFRPDGALALDVGNEGRGCGTRGVYHPVLRVEPAGAPHLSLAGSGRATPLTAEGQAEWPAGGPQRLLLDGAAGQLTLAPAWGDAELAYVYWTEAAPAEGQGDLPSIGGCCALDAAQGPEQFIGPGAPQPLTRPVIWFVPRIRNAERSRCWADSAIVDGALVPQVWPCHAGLTLEESS